MEGSGHCTFGKIKTGMQKFERISETIFNQIEKGDFSLSGLPSERILSERLAANRLTVRKALVVLAEKGIIQKLKNGRYDIVPKSNGNEKDLKVAFLTSPTFYSGNIHIWYEELQTYTNKHNIFLRPFLYLHWDDVSISNILATFDGIFIVSSEEEIPQDTLKQLQSKTGVVMINNNIDRYHILSINLFPGVFVRHVLDRLGHLGHKSISCLHLESDRSDVLQDRINQWKYWGVLNDNDAPLIKADINPFNEGDAFLASQIKKGHFKDATAVFCTTIHAAIAMIRACKDNGIDPEKDIAICTVDDEGIGMHSTPSVSCFKKPDIQKILHPVFNWIKAGGDLQKWNGPLLIEPVSLKFYKGETFHPPGGTIRRRVE